MMTRATATVALAVALLVAGCSTDPATQLVVVVDTNLDVPEQIEEIRVSVTGPSGTTTIVSESLDDGGAALPLTLGVSPAGEELGPVEVTADGLLAGSLVVTRAARTRLIAGETLTLYLFLSSACVGEECPEGQTCTPNGCEPVEIDPEDLPPWTGAPPMRDAGLADGSAPDGAPSDGGIDAGPTGCTAAAECDDGLSCTVDVCDDGACAHMPDDALCTAGPDGFCDAVDGCQYSECTAATCVAEPCQTAECDASGRCVRTTLCEAGQTCCANTCVTAGCDDGNPCTDDACGSGGCENTGNTATCDDGLYCNGADTCSGGSCATHAGSPCSGSAVCDESMDVCTGCLSDTDCGDDVLGTWSGCSGFTGTCGESGTRTRTVTSYSCVSGTCTPSESTETGSCSRDTDGTVCGSTSCGTYGSCGGFSSTCDESGTQSRTCTDRVCASGSCTDSSRTETSSCSRDTDGNSCGTESCGSFSTCAYSSSCDESGSQSRTCTTYTCASGSCSSSDYTDTDTCTRDTDGTLCEDGDDRTCESSCTSGVCGGGYTCPSGCHCPRGFVCEDDGSGAGTICPV